MIQQCHPVLIFVLKQKRKSQGRKELLVLLGLQTQATPATLLWPLTYTYFPTAPFCFQRVLTSGKASYINRILYSYSPASFPSGYA